MRIAPWLVFALCLGCVSLPRPPPTGVSGQVLKWDGAPAVGARIGVIARIPSWDLRTDAPLALVEAGAEGRFQLGPLAPGEYGLSAVTAEGLLVFGDTFTVEAGKPVSPLELRVRETPFSLEGAVVDEAGTPVSGVNVRIVRAGMPYDDVAFLPSSPEGRFQVRGPSGGRYSVIASAPGFTTWMKRVESPRQPLTVRMERTASASQRQAAVAWMNQTGVPLKSVEAGQGVEDLRPLERVLRDVRVVALGEATHGTREFFQLKHRMFEFLVTRLGFTVFAIEENFAESLALNEYVLTGRGDPARSLNGSTWNTQEVLALIEWMRHYNEDPSHPRKLKFYGVDMQFSPEAVARVEAYLAKVDATHVERVKEPLALLAGPKGNSFAQLPGERQVAVRDALDTLAHRFEQEQAEYVRRSSPKEWELARQNVRVLRQYVGKVLHEEDELRDHAMADNLLWVLEHEGPEARAVFWAHNGHVQRGPGEWTEAPVGRHLSEALGPALYVFGFAFHQGAFQAYNMDANPAPGRKGMVEFSVPPSPEDSLDAALAATGWPVLALDLRALPHSSPAWEWWRRAQRTHDIGFICSDQGYPTLSLVHALELYDGLLFVEHTSRARPLPKHPVLPSTR